MNNINVNVELDTSGLAAEMCLKLSQDDIIDFVLEIDRAMEDEGFTRRLATALAEETRSFDSSFLKPTIDDLVREKIEQYGNRAVWVF